MRKNWVVLLMVCLAVVMMAVLPGCRSGGGGGNGDGDDISTVIGKAGTYNFKLADLAWEKVEEPANENMSKMMVYAAGEENPNAIETDAEATDPDFSKVSGGGFYIESAGNPDGALDLRGIRWTGDEEVVETFDENEARDPAATAMIKNGATRLAVSVDSELGWIVYNPDYAAEDAGEGEFAQMDKYYGGRIKFYGAVGDYSGIAEGTYAYTMFAKNPTAGEVPEIDTELDMTSGSVTMVFDSEESPWPVLIKLLIRDANGDWYLGGVQEDLPDPTPTPTPDEPEEVAEVDETFGWDGWGGIVGYNQNSGVRVSDATGFPWSGYSPTGGENNPINSDEHWGSRIKFEKGLGNIPGNYVFTIFDTAGGNQPNRWIDMSSGTMALSLDQEGEAPYPMGIKVLVRDGDGDWFLGGLSGDGVSVSKESSSVAFADLDWEKVGSDVADWMNQMEAGDSSAYGMVIEGGTADPDLAEVTGGGIFIDSIEDADAGHVVLSGIKWSAE